KARRGIEVLENPLARAGFKADDELIEYLGRNSLGGDRAPEPDPADDDLLELVVRYAARCPDDTEARKVYTESAPLYNNGPARVGGIGTRPPLKELFALWPCLIPREDVTETVEILEV